MSARGGTGARSRAGGSGVPELRLSAFSALREFRRDPLGLLERAAALGDVVSVSLPRFDAYLVNHPDLVRDLLVSGHRDFRKGRAIEDIKRVLGEGLLTSEGEHHRRQRRLIQPIFRHDRIAGYGAAMVERAARLADAWTPGSRIDVHAQMQRLTLAIVGTTLFATDVEAAEARGVGEALAALLRGFSRLNTPYGTALERLPLPGNRRVAAAQRFLDQTIERMIADRRAAGARGEDLMSRLLRARDADTDAEGDAGTMTDRQVRDEAMTLLLAGHETTSNALAFTWHLLGREPEAEAALHAELDRVLGGRAPTVGDLPRLPVTQAVVSESMRLYPPAWILGRRAMVDHEVGSTTIPRDAIAVVSPWLLHRDERWWPEPTGYRLDRWAPEAVGERHRLAYLPFGAGPRRCVGEPFAWMELVLVVATIARGWRLRPVPGHRLELEPIVTLRPRGGLPMRLDPRS